MSKLYEIANEFSEVMAMVESGDLSIDDVKDTIDAMSMEFKDKAKNCLMFLRIKESEVDAAKKEIDRINAIKNSAQASCDKMKQYVKQCMEQMELKSLDLQTFKVTLKAPTQKVEVLEESKIPSEYFRVIPETKAVDKVKLLAALKLGEVEGAELVDGERALLIK